MAKNLQLLHAVSIVCGAILAIGILLFLVGFVGNGYMNFTPIGMGTIMGGIFIFLMGLFFVATEEMLEKTRS